MRASLKALSTLLSYPDDDFKLLYNNRDELVDALSREDPEVASLVNEFLDKIDPESADETYVAVFEMPPKCSLYAHEYLLHGKEEELGRFLLELKGIYKIHGVDAPLKKEIPDFLPLMLEFLALVYDVDREEARRFAKRYLKKWIGELARCLEKEGSPYALLARAVEKIVNDLAQAR
ncbi:MAG: nitrate reductase molybdenum cofactor assembly chaperone [Desulfurococcales archaeon]|nr:nitrate reductase molybdenum cofactor assembly chaperone [Desulfurococcales archaeon]